MADDDLPYIVIERRTGGFAAFIWGAIIGAGAALLLAPRSGQETRAEIGMGVRRIRDRAEQTVRDLQNSVTETLDGVRTEVTDTVDAARDAFEAGRQAARDTRSDMERRVNETRARVRAGIDAARRTPAADAQSRTGAATVRSVKTDGDPESNLGV